MSKHTRTGGVIGLVVSVVGAVPAFGSVHLMQIEQVIGAVNGDKTAQAIQLRMRGPFETQTQGSSIRAWDAAGLNPIVLVTAGSSVPNGSARILFASPNFAAHTTPSAVPNFIMTNLIPASYLAAGSLTFEAPGFGIIWRLSWGGASYTGTGSGSFNNDADGNFNPPFAGPLPTNCTRAVLFTGTAGAASTNNAAQYAVTGGDAVFTNNAGAAFTVNACVGDGNCNDSIACTADACMSGCCVFTPNNASCPDDSMFCNGTEFCDATLGCRSTGTPCTTPPNLFCDEVFDICGTCDDNGDCNDGIACTNNTCMNGSCVYTPDNGLCPSDGQFCTGVETCNATLGCVSSGNPCSSSQTCDEPSDTCLVTPLHIALEVVAGGPAATAAGPTLSSPLQVTHTNDGTFRLFVVDQIGLIRVIVGGALEPTPFLDISAKLPTLGTFFDERGLLGLAFHPNYSANGRFFVRYSAPRAGDPTEPCNAPCGFIVGCHKEILAEYQVMGDPVTSNVADPDSEIILFSVDKPEFNHDGGHVAFGPDGLLYFSIGDGGGANDDLHLDGVCDAGYCSGNSSTCNCGGPPAACSVSAQDCVDLSPCVSCSGPCTVAQGTCGDGSTCVASGGPPPHGPIGNAQNINAALGKMLRVDVNTAVLDLAGWKYNPGTGHWYRLTTDFGTWAEANAAAIAEGGYLTTICSQEENDWVTQLATIAAGATERSLEGNNAWIGYRDAGSGWGWENGETCGYTNLHANWNSYSLNHAYILGANHGEPGFWGRNQLHDNEFIRNVRGIIERDTPLYAIPDNPFAGATPGLDEIYAYGLRNPYRWSFDRGTGDLYLGDAGQDIYEEVDIIDLGENYGWAAREGAHFFDPFNPGIPPASCLQFWADAGIDCSTLIDPISEYTHAEGGTAVIGGYVYRGAAYPQLQGIYVYGDFSFDFGPTGNLYYFELSGPDEFVRQEFFIAPNGDPFGKFLKGFGEDEDGEVYVCASGTLAPNGTDGVVYKIVPPPPGEIAWNSDPLSPDRTTRSLRFRLEAPASQTATGTSPQVAIRVTMVDLQHPVPANLPTKPPKDFTTFDTRLNGVCSGGDLPGHHCDSDADCPGGGTCSSLAACTATGNTAAWSAGEDTTPDAAGGFQGGCARWVGRPGTFMEAQGPPSSGPFRAARLQCTPFYFDWVTETAGGTIAVVGAEIAPSSEYSVQAFGSSCKGAEGGCSNVSTPVTMLTRRFGDAASMFAPPEPSGQPNSIDVAQLVAKFKGATTASLVKAVTQLQPNLPELNADVGALDIVAAVDAVKELAYAISGPCPCPSQATCNALACATPGTCTASALAGLGTGAMCVKTCTGGDNAGEPCINDTHCAGGTCGAGFCRDRCGRCN